MTILQYANWQNFEKIIEKAKISCKNSDINVFEHFTDVNKLSKRANNAEVTINDYKLTRYACYIIAQNGDSRKKVIALAQNNAKNKNIFNRGVKNMLNNQLIAITEYTLNQINYI